jgi:hypothetical protein
MEDTRRDTVVERCQRKVEKRSRLVLLVVAGATGFVIGVVFTGFAVYWSSRATHWETVIAANPIKVLMDRRPYLGKVIEFRAPFIHVGGNDLFLKDPQAVLTGVSANPISVRIPGERFTDTEGLTQVASGTWIVVRVRVTPADEHGYGRDIGELVSFELLELP